MQLIEGVKFHWREAKKMQKQISEKQMSNEQFKTYLSNLDLQGLQEHIYSYRFHARFDEVFGALILAPQWWNIGTIGHDLEHFWPRALIGMPFVALYALASSNSSRNLSSLQEAKKELSGRPKV